MEFIKLLMNRAMTTDEEKMKIANLLQDLDVPEIKLSERSSEFVRDFLKRFGEPADEQLDIELQNVYENPYKVDQLFLEENAKKLKELQLEHKRFKKIVPLLTGPDSKRPWRINSNREKLLRIDGELKRHHEKASQLIHPMAEDEIKDLIKECEETIRVAPSAVTSDTLRLTIEAAKKNLPNFQYRSVNNSTATQIMCLAHHEL